MAPANNNMTPTGVISEITSQMENLSASLPIAEEAIARDCADDDSPFEEDRESESDGSSTIRQYSMVSSYRRPSYVNPGARSSALVAPSMPTHSQSPETKKHSYLSRKEREAMRDEERSLLRDNHLLPPKHPRRGSEGLPSEGFLRKSSFPALRKSRSAPVDEEAANHEPSEQTALLGGNPDLPYGGLDSPKTLNRKWDEAVAAGKITTTWRREAKVLTKSSAPLILTFLLQYSLPVASIFTVGHIGKVELGAVSLASSKSLSHTTPREQCLTFPQ
jgi:MATE family multidrug resistance protein